MAKCFGLDPFDIHERWSLRQCKIVRRWIKTKNDEAWNNPSRSDYYMMRIAQRVHQANSKREITLDDQRVKFRDESLATQADRTANSKARWFAFTGYDQPEQDPLRGTQHGSRT